MYSKSEYLRVCVRECVSYWVFVRVFTCARVHVCEFVCVCAYLSVNKCMKNACVLLYGERL